MAAANFKRGNQEPFDRLWEADVNWKTLNPGDEEDGVVDEAIYVPVMHDPDNFTPIYAVDLVETGVDATKLEFETLRDLLANHLQYMYMRGMLRWPKTRTEIKDKRHNTIVRENFPQAGDLEN